MKHTPGPWKTGTPGRGRFCVYSSAHGRGICVMSNTQKSWDETMVAKHGEHELNLIADANARLIAAAPDMLAALVALHESLPLEFVGTLGKVIDKATGVF